MYQWVEKVEEHSKSKSYHYEKLWSMKPINSSSFRKKGYNNPPFEFSEKRLLAKNVRLGAFNLTEKQISDMDDFVQITNLPNIPGYRIHDGYYYSGNSAFDPQVGDIRISYLYVPSGANISVIGEQLPNNTIDAKSTDKGPLYIRFDGKYNSLEEILNKYKQTNNNSFFNFCIIFILFVAFIILFANTSLSRCLIPFSRMNMPIKVILFSALSTTVVSALVYVLAWYVSRPFLTFIILYAVALFFIIKAVFKKR